MKRPSAGPRLSTYQRQLVADPDALQAELAFRARVGELHRAFLGRVRYLVLRERGLVTAPAVRVVRRGVKLDRDELLIGRTEVALARVPRFRGPDRRGKLPWTALPEVLTPYDDGASVR